MEGKGLNSSHGPPMHKSFGTLHLFAYTYEWADYESYVWLHNMNFCLYIYIT